MSRLSFLFFAPFHSFEHAQQSSRSLGNRITRPSVEVSAAEVSAAVEEVEEGEGGQIINRCYPSVVFFLSSKLPRPFGAVPKTFCK